MAVYTVNHYQTDTFVYNKSAENSFELPAVFFVNN